MKYLPMSFAAVALFLVAGCSSQPEENLKFPSPKVSLTIQDAGKDVSLRPGEFAMISLKENASTGYSWYFRLDNGQKGPQPKGGQAVELAGERVIPPKDMMPGAPGMREVMVKAVRPGTVYVVGRCIRPWDKDQTPAQTIRYRFDVR